MAVTTIKWALWVNKETQDVINQINWVKTKEQIIWEFFWLKKEVIYSDDWQEVIDFINEFKNEKELKAKWVKYCEALSKLWITEQEFYTFIPKEYAIEWDNTSTRKSKNK